MPLLNLRDVAAETALRPGVLYRSAQPHTLTQADAELVASLRLIADLRGDDERAPGDWALALGGAVRHAPLGAGSTSSPAQLAALPPDLDLGDLYVGILQQRTAWFAGVIAEIADGLPALIHCAAGKDRTGIVVALILDLLGVDHEAIVRDYALTAKELPDVLAMLDLMASPGMPPTLLEAPESAMRTFLAALATQGGAERLLLANGLTRAHADRLRTALLP
ncbi:tyrosine-protein phosphatase [Nonomuraea jiangxiensis]|uniref:Protein-tyrosine phosphatase n=1 Tax=Nonomuraea jiangxiensis TaxID=633440 RepID=A0A1G7Y5S4_9ACTN|nr:tyrosine-protein phosphatase [Nonomuraea jiangxiensis]SDG91805.1 protein-tyrosine phosphatase [Nonomuraea jiangxiensis]